MPLVGTSSKMNLTPSQAAVYCSTLRDLVADIGDRRLFVLPPFPAIPCARQMLTGSNVAWGAQDVHPDDEGAHTGDVSAPMLADLGCTYVEVGHHERRRAYGETDDLIAAKVLAVQRWGMTAILCVGEEARTGVKETAAAVLVQLRYLEDFDSSKLIVAYEPAWAIGTGAEAANPRWVSKVHAAIHARLSGSSASGAAAPVIYGGSVDPSTAGPLLAARGVDGLFVGRSALKPEVFSEIAHARAK